ncbi:hypothetical protein [Pengzhenrongella sp.]|uniref:hypothetical protein n=1 Tax=Pengzhenrongella sp. TaxID=2888820 RepID=UPI002F935788
MPEGQTGWPSRSAVEAVWRAVANGEQTREDAHVWTLPWVEPWVVDGPARDTGPSEALVESGLQHIHGLSMAYNPETPHLIHDGPPGIYVRTLDMVRADLEKWIDDCRRYDENPEEFRRLAWELARPYVEAERAKQRRQSEAGEPDTGLA